MAHAPFQLKHAHATSCYYVIVVVILQRCMILRRKSWKVVLFFSSFPFFPPPNPRHHLSFLKSKKQNVKSAWEQSYEVRKLGKPNGAPEASKITQRLWTLEVRSGGSEAWFCHFLI